MKTVILYYSYDGNTSKIAKQIQKEIKADIAEIETVKAYKGDYDSVVDQGQEEVNTGYMPKIKSLRVNIKDYDRIILGMPVWWYTFAPAVKTFLHENDLSGKIIVPFITNAGWIGHTFEDLERECSRSHSKVENMINIKFSGQRMVMSQDTLNKWIKSLT